MNLKQRYARSFRAVAPDPALMAHAEQRVLEEMKRRNRARFARRRRMLAAASVAAALALIVVFVGQPIVEAATKLYQRLFGQVVGEIEERQAQPEDEKLDEMTRMYESASRGHRVEGANAQIGGVTVSVAWVRVMPVDRFSGDPKGELDLTLVYSKIPSFDPSWVDFTLAVDGREIPMQIDEDFKKYYRDQNEHTLTEEEWADDWSDSNSHLENGVPTTRLTFGVDDWQWDQSRSLVLKVEIDGQALSIPFAFDPIKAREQATEDAKVSVALEENRYAREKDELAAMRENAVPVGLTGSAYGYDWAVSEMSYANDKLYFTTAFGGFKTKNPHEAGAIMGFWLDGPSVDGMWTGPEVAGSESFKDGAYTAVYDPPLARDPRKLPEESLIRLTLEFGDAEKAKDVAFRYNWKEKKVTLPRDAIEMKDWVEQARELEEALRSRYPSDVGFDLTPLHLTQEADSVKMTLAAVNYNHETGSLEIYPKYEGDASASRYSWMYSPVATVNGYRCYDGFGQFEGDVTRNKFDLCVPLNISEFGNGNRVALEFPLYLKGSDIDTAEPAVTLRYEFTIDKSTLKPWSPDD